MHCWIMENSQHSRITYPEFENNIGTIWRELQQEKDFCDMTLGCNGRQIYAHKAIISACSPVLRNILKQNLEKAPFIYLRGIKKTNLNNLLNFKYQGEVNVFEKDLRSFCKLAQDLKIEGFFKESNSKEDKSIKINSFHINISMPSLKRKKIIKENTEGMVYKQCDKAIVPKTFVKSANCDYRLSEAGNLKRHNEQINAYPCDQCQQSFIQTGQLLEHIKSVHDGLRFPCSNFDYKSTQTGNLKRHTKQRYSDRIFDDGVKEDFLESTKENIKKNFSCQQCGKYFIKRGHLLTHIRYAHKYPHENHVDIYDNKKLLDISGDGKEVDFDIVIKVFPKLSLFPKVNLRKLDLPSNMTIETLKDLLLPVRKPKLLSDVSNIDFDGNGKALNIESDDQQPNINSDMESNEQQLDIEEDQEMINEINETSLGIENDFSDSESDNDESEFSDSNSEIDQYHSTETKNNTDVRNEADFKEKSNHKIDDARLDTDLEGIDSNDNDDFSDSEDDEEDRLTEHDPSKTNEENNESNGNVVDDEEDGFGDPEKFETVKENIEIYENMTDDEDDGVSDSKPSETIKDNKEIDKNMMEIKSIRQSIMHLLKSA